MLEDHPVVIVSATVQEAGPLGCCVWGAIIFATLMSPITVASYLSTRFSDKGKVVIFCSDLYRREIGGNGGNGTYPVPYGFRERASLLNSALLELTDSSPRHQFYELDRRLISYIIMSLTQLFEYSQ